MSATEILEQFRQMPFSEQCELVQLIEAEFKDELPSDIIARFEERAEWLRRNPEQGITWEKVRAELKGRLAQRRACPREIIFEPEARLEFEDAVFWHDTQQTGLGDRFEAEIHAVFSRILKNPERFPLDGKTVRRARVEIFDSYSVYFTIEPAFIGIVSIFHGARNPTELQRRLK